MKKGRTEKMIELRAKQKTVVLWLSLLALVWVATGRVTQAVPGYFPGFERKIPTSSDIRSLAENKSPSLESILDELAVYEYGEDENILFRLREYIQRHKNDAETRKQCEIQLLEFLETEASLAGKMAVCRQLRLIGSQRSVAILEKMLYENDTSDMARYALEKIPGSEPNKALLRCLKSNTTYNIIGIVSSLGQRGVISAVPEFSRLLNNPNNSIVAAVLKALGWIGGDEATEVLFEALIDEKGEMRFQTATSLLLCADKFQAMGQPLKAVDIYKKMIDSQFPHPIREAALKGLLISDKNGAKSLLLDVLNKEDVDLHIAAIGQIRSILKDSEIQEVLELIPNLNSRSKTALFPVLSEYPSSLVLAAVLEATEDEEAGVRIAALEALQILGDGATVPLLVKRAAQTKDREKQAAQFSLWNLKGPEINQTILLELTKAKDPSLQRELIRCVGERRIEEGKQILFDFASSSDPLTRQETIRNLGKITSASDLPELLELLLESDLDSEKASVRQAIAITASSITDRNRQAAAVIEKLKIVQSDQGRGDLLRVLGVIGDNSTLPLLRVALKNPSSFEYSSAVRALAEWPDITPRDDLLGTARTAEDLNLRVISLRAYIQMVGSERYRSPVGVVQSLKRGLDVAERPEEKVQILALLPNFPCAQAIELAESLLSDETVKAEASLALKKIRDEFIKNSGPI